MSDSTIRLVEFQANVQLYSSFVKKIESEHGHLDILVNDAGIAEDKTTPGGETAEEFKKNLYDATSEEDWLDTYKTNVYGPYLMSMAFVPLLQKATEKTKGWSSTIINISSISGTVRITQGHAAYNASKGAMVHLNKMIATEIQGSGLKIRVNAIAPGVFPSGMNNILLILTTMVLTYRRRDDYPRQRREPEEPHAKGEEGNPAVWTSRP